ncbi:hypothetical protein BC941DRAFT_416987 [Chlamydoabsidia padenii]|nr:hypothetical protein BC941DRAFT_416987 [Chlamydoabsidia padenii]
MITHSFEPSSHGTTHHSTLNKNGITRPTRKRTHLTTSHIASLQASFAKNPLPDSSIRHGLSLSLGITERTVQIWFQNRRAKARKLEDLANGKFTAGAPGGNNSSTPASSSSRSTTPATNNRFNATFRTLMTPQLFEERNATNNLSSSADSARTHQPSSCGSFQRRPRSASKSEKPKLAPAPLAPRCMSEDMNLRHQQASSLNPFNTSGPLGLNHNQSNIVTLPAHLLRIGTWTRFANINTNSEWGLLCYCTNDYLVWQIQAEGQQFRIHIPFGAIRQLSFGSTDDTAIDQLNIQIDPQQLIFSMCLNQQYQAAEEEWVRCGDFSEGKQASLLYTHEIQGHHDMLQQAVVNLLTCIPVLAPKLVLLASPLMDDSTMSRDLTISPSATPEPSSFMMNAALSATTVDTMYSNHHHAAATTLDKSMMQQAPFYYPPSSHDDQHIYNQMMIL